MATITTPCTAEQLDPLTEAFLHPVEDSNLVMSPDGHTLAAISVIDHVPRVIAIDPETGRRRTILGWSQIPGGFGVKYRPRFPVAISWMSDDVLAVSFDNHTAESINLAGKLDTFLYSEFLGMYRADGGAEMSAIVRIRANETKLGSVLLHGFEMHDFGVALRGDSLLDWLTDESGSLRVVRTLTTATNSDATRVATWYRASVDASWDRIDERSINDDPFKPLLLMQRPDHLAVQARNGGDKLAVWDFDAGRHAFGSTIISDPDDDIVGLLTEGYGRRFTSFETDGLTPRTVWIDPRMASFQKMIDEAIPGHVNRLQAETGQKVLVESISDIEPRRVFIFDTQKPGLREIPLRSWALDRPATPIRTLRYPSFDGLQIPSYLTVPAGSPGPAPLVVLIHGGPQARDRWEWNAEVQALAAHGYAVFQPQFRGSSGFGKRFEQSGYGQWGLAMQDDITAGVRYLIGKGIADPKRICIVGGSYGGYAALWGLAKTPDLYRCGVSVAGVTDIELMLHDDSDRVRSAIQREYMKTRIGDPHMMQADWDSVSPLKHADRIHVPVLIVHGDLDERVPISHGRKMFLALQQLDKDVKWLEFPDEAHGILHLNNLRAYYAAMFSLLDRTIGDQRPQDITPTATRAP